MKPLDDYQIVARDFLLAENQNLRALWDECGVGKTAPAIAAGVIHGRETGLPILVTCPPYLIDNWQREIAAFAPAGTTVTAANGSGPAARDAALQAESDFILTGYSNWSAKTAGKYRYPELLSRQWGALIFDEVHRLRGRQSLCTRHVQGMRRAKECNRETPVWGLTGTPIVNNPGDLFPLLNLWKPRVYRSYWKFVNEWCKITTTPWDTIVGQLKPEKEEEWQALTREFSLRRTQKELVQLSHLEEVHQDFEVQLPKSVQKTIAQARKEYRLQHADLPETEYLSGGGALYSRLRQLATLPPTNEKPKLSLCRELLEDRTGPVVVYCWYKDSAAGVAEELAKTKRPVTVITGDVPAEDRQELVDTWKRDPAGILVATISSLKEGISLIHASTVIFLEHSELPADQEQCVARLKRRGQTRLVEVFHVWALGSPDTAIKKAVTERGGGIQRALRAWLTEGE